MTSRLTMEIQGVPFDNIEPLREYLMQAGLETGGEQVLRFVVRVPVRYNLSVQID